MSAAHRAVAWQRRALSCGALLACAALALPAQTARAAPHEPPGPAPSSSPSQGDGEALPDGTALPEGAPPPDGVTEESLQALLDRLQTLYRKAEEATEEYNDARDRLSEQRRTVKDLGAKLTAQRAQVRRHRRDAGQLARRQYMNGGLSGYTKLLLSSDPQSALDRGHLLGQAAKAEASTIERLQAEERGLDRLKGKQEKALGKVEKTAGRQRAARDKVEEQLDRVEKIVSSLTGAEIEQLQQLEEDGFTTLQADFLRSGVLGTGNRAPSAAGRTAVSFAFDQLGEPYIWGAAGPDAFDCSGLTSQAWLHAGRPVPRTSQEQWKRLHRVSLDLVRPGDLVVYFPGATHVGMYIGDGMIIHAPRPGGFVRVAPVGSMPVLGAVRPDPGAESSGPYTTPEIPGAATRPTPIGVGERNGNNGKNTGNKKPEKQKKKDKQDGPAKQETTGDKDGKGGGNGPADGAVNTAEGSLTKR